MKKMKSCSNLNFFVNILRFVCYFSPQFSQFCSGLQNFAKLFLNFCELCEAFRSLPKLSEAFRSLPKPSEAFTPRSGIGTSSAGVCIWPMHPLLACSCARPAGRSPRRCNFEAKSPAARVSWLCWGLWAEVSGNE